jgi:hypothetical protein
MKTLLRQKWLRTKGGRIEEDVMRDENGEYILMYVNREVGYKRYYLPNKKDMSKDLKSLK